MAGQTRQQRRYSRRPELSQHFIKSNSTAERLVGLARVGHDDLVVEAGPGTGALTTPLAAKVKRVIAVESDRTLYKTLYRRFENASNVTIRHNDFLRYQLPSGPYTFFANIPFAKTAAIVRKLILGASPPQRAFIIVESLAAARFLGRPFGPESTLSLTLKARYQPSILAWLRPETFEPRPSVNSVFMRLEDRAEPMSPGSTLRDFDRFARSAFTTGDRSVDKALRRHLPLSQVRSLARELGFPSGASASTISFEHWVTVFNLINWNRQHDR